MKPGIMKGLLLVLLLVARAACAAVPPDEKSLADELALKLKAALATVPPAERLLPADTLAFLTVPDWSKAGTNFSNSALGQIWADPAMKAFKDKFFEKFNADKVQPLEKELGFQFTNFFNLTRGQFTLAVVPNGWDGRSEKQPGVLWLMDTRENSALLKTNLTGLRQKWSDAGKNIRTNLIHGVEFTAVIVPPPADAPAGKAPVEWVIGQSGSLLVLSDTAKDVEKVLSLQSGMAGPALAEQAVFAPSAGMLRDAPSFAWVNVKPIMSALARRPAAPVNGGAVVMNSLPSSEIMLTSLGLSGVQTITFNIQQGTEGTTAHLAVRVPENLRRGLFNILAVQPRDASPPPFIPADVVKFNRWRVDLQTAWTTIENMLGEISPAYAGFSKLILDTAGKDKDPKFDFRKQLLANLGDDVMVFERAPRAEATGGLSFAPSLMLIGSTNAVELAASLRAITSIFPPEMIKYREREFLGRTVYSVVLPPLVGQKVSRPLTYSATNGYVAISSDPAPVEEFLRSSGATTNALRDLPGLNDAAQHVGGMGTGYFSFENEAESARGALDATKKDPSAIASILGAGQISTFLGWVGGETNAMTEAFDLALLPAYDKVAKYFYLNVNALVVTPDGITFKMFTPTPPPPLRK